MNSKRIPGAFQENSGCRTLCNLLRNAFDTAAKKAPLEDFRHLSASYIRSEMAKLDQASQLGRYSTRRAAPGS
jgi:hypothetical protein